MKSPYAPSNVALSGTLVTTSATLIRGGTGSLKSIPGRKLLSFPLHALTGSLYVLAWPDGTAAPTATQIQNGGAKYAASDRVCELMLDEQSDIYAVVDAGSFAIYETEWV